MPLYAGVFGNPSGDGFDRLENGVGKVLVTFDNELINCNKYFANGLEYLDKGKPEKAKASLLKALKGK